MSSNKIILKKA